ncbi:FecR family protein [Sphingobacterium oryzagri]|uniref:FecR family protein n=1 Tax=Sphingobacterium oryzagri TaxID=3025669 RepID=A0ABY7WLA4_9SPHI|nr:FecR family protein [Sphingobacterium sp. KACC 22765]WDF70381.1 FecR family protein [Sphingobacterium sp. KACC 22765]
MKEQRTKQLFRRSISQKLTESEIAELDVLLAELSDDMQEKLYFEACDEALAAKNSDVVPPFSYEEKQRILAEIVTKNTSDVKYPRRRVYRKFVPYVAACFVLALTAFSLFFLPRPSEVVNYGSLPSASTVAEDLDPGQERAVLTMEDGRSITLDTIAVGNQVNGLDFKIVRLSSGELQYQTFQTTRFPQEHVIHTPKGGTINVILPDGSKVWLNAASSLTFNSDMQSADRRVEVDGEVYFEVAKRKKQRFIVKSRTSEIQVLGTKFNVNTYQGNQTKVGLLEGSVLLKTAKVTRRMKPSELAVIQANGYTKTTSLTNISDIILWKQGIFHFQDTSPEVLANELSRWYNIDVSVQGKELGHRINGKIARDLKLSKMMEVLDFLGLSATYKENKLIIKTKKT